MRRADFLLTWLFPTIFFLSALLPTYACADGINFRSEFTYTNSEATSTNKTTGEKIDSESYLFKQRYNFDASKTIYPQLTFSAGTLFELNESTTKTEGTKSKFEERRLVPFVQLRLSNPIYQAGIEYRRSQRKELFTDTPDIETARDEFSSSLGWDPAGLPTLGLRYSYSHTYDDPDTIDQIQRSLILRTDYTLWEALQLNYVYTRSDTEDRLRNSDTLDQTHLGRIEYSDGFLEQKLLLNTSYKIRYNTFESSRAAGEGADVAVQRSQGLFSLDNTPEDGPALQVNNALIDGNVSASAGIDIGLGGDETTLTNIGLDFGFASDVDEVRIWVDRSLSASVANSFSWDIYTSPDNTDGSTWTLVATVSPADFGTFENRFEIPFPEVNTRFIKVVTTPLAPTVPDAANFPNIFVTEMQAFTTVSGGGAQSKLTTLDQDYDLSLTARLSEKTVAGYHLNYIWTEVDPSSQKTSRLTNDIFVNHTFNRIFSTSARVSRIDSTENNDDTVEHIYSALIRGSYLPTFDQTLSLSGKSVKTEDDSGDDYVITLRNNIKLYRGWSAFVDAGYNWNRPLASSTVNKNILVRAGTNLRPNEKFTVNMNYQLRKTVSPDASSRYDWNIEAFYVPVRTLSLNASYSIVHRQDTRTLQNYVVTWSPFPDGDLQFFFTYSERLRSVENVRQTTIGPGLTWKIGNHFFFETTYTILRDESNTQKLESNNFLANLRITF